jgi:hypothetical protein
LKVTQHRHFVVIQIRHGNQPYKELEIRGSTRDLADLQRVILEFCHSPETACDSAIHSRPLRLCKTSELLLISVVEHDLLISGKVEFLECFANGLTMHIPQRGAHAANQVLEAQIGNRSISQAALFVVVSDA